jgi:hypothetical protein
MGGTTVRGDDRRPGVAYSCTLGRPGTGTVALSLVFA